MAQYNVTARWCADLSVEISAKTLAQAVEKSKDLKLQDFAKVLGSYDDGNFAIKGVYNIDRLPEAE